MRSVRIGSVARMLRLSVSRVRQLADSGAIPFERSTGQHRLFDPRQVAVMLDLAASEGDDLTKLGPPQFSREYALPGLEEHAVWQDIAGKLLLDTSDPGVHVAEYGLEEMVNNAIDHSDGRDVLVMFWKSGDRILFTVSDDGIGALRRLRESHGLPDLLSAIQELPKGKRTTAPDRHSGQGIFFTSRAVTRFTLSANGWRWIRDNEVSDQTVEEAADAGGTTIICSLSLPPLRTMEDVFREFTPGGQFDRSKPSVKLLSYGTRLISRSEAKLLLEGLQEFREVELDFAGVESVGQGFVDEVFRVWARKHPNTVLIPVGMNGAVEFMVERGLPSD